VNTSRHRLLTFAVLAIVSAIAISGCGSSSAKSAASVTLKPMSEWNAMSMTHTSTTSTTHTTTQPMKMTAAEMQKMSTSKEGLPYIATTAHGEAYFQQVGDHLTGWRRVTGLVPYSGHANHLHGPDGACSPPSKQTSNMAVVLPDLVANSKGEAYGTVNLVVHQQVVGPGYFLVVHAKPTPASQRNQIGSAPASMAFMQAMSNDPAMLCGNITLKS